MFVWKQRDGSSASFFSDYRVDFPFCKGGKIEFWKLDSNVNDSASDD